MKFESKVMDIYVEAKDLDDKEFMERYRGPKDVITNSWLFIIKEELDEYFEELSQRPYAAATSQLEVIQEKPRKRRAPQDDHKKAVRRAKSKARRNAKKKEELEAQLAEVEKELKSNKDDKFLLEKRTSIEEEISKYQNQMVEAEEKVMELEGDDGEDTAEDGDSTDNS